MSRILVEMVLLAFAGMYTGILLFVANVLQRIFNDLETDAFARFMPLLYKRAGYSVFMVATVSVPFFGMFAYFVFYRFDNLIFSAGLILFSIGVAISKHNNTPIYRDIMAADPADAAVLSAARKRLQTANFVRAAIGSAAFAVMVAGLV
jgi:small neutral amino acid transporter SnatA (MarC family)